MIAKNMHSDDMEKTQKLEIEAVIADYYLEAVGSCEQWDECPSGVDWLELIKSVQLLRKYLEKKDRKELQISLNEWNRVRSIDNILNTEIKTTCRDFQTKNIPLCVLEKKTLVYMDFGVYQLYESNEVFHTQLDNYAEMDEIQFVYSPTHMEEVCRMDNSIFEGKRRDNISKICSNCEVFLVRDGCLKILTEPVEVCFDRAKKLQVLNQYAEESECATFEALEEKTCGLLRWDEKEVETHRKEISLLTSTQLFDPKNEMIDNESINRVFYEICGSRFPVEDFKDYCKKERTFSEIREAVRLLFILMNALGYHRNKIEKGDSGDWIEIMERLCDKWNCYDFQHFINGVKKENPRHISKQLGAIEQFLDSENPDRALVADVMKRCCDNYRYQFSQFKVVYEYVKAGRSLADSDGARVVVSSDRVEYKDLSVYGKAFQERVNRSGQEAAV